MNTTVSLLWIGGGGAPIIDLSHGKLVFLAENEDEIIRVQCASGKEGRKGGDRIAQLVLTKYVR